jgi:hypothetical protein
MELDNLKEIWKGLDDKKTPVGSNEEILSMLQKKSKRPIARMKRNLLVEMVSVIIIYSASTAYYFMAWSGRYWEIGLMFFLAGVFCVFYYYRKYKLLNSMECVACEVKSNLQRQLTTLEKYVRLYFITGVVLTPIAYFFAGFIIFVKTPGNSYNLNQYLIFTAIGIVITIACYYLNVWYVNKLYGQHVRKLKEILSEMEGTENGI